MEELNKLETAAALAAIRAVISDAPDLIVYHPLRTCEKKLEDNLKEFTKKLEDNLKEFNTNERA
jgi:hypothetical protein